MTSARIAAIVALVALAAGLAYWTTRSEKGASAPAADGKAGEAKAAGKAPEGKGADGKAAGKGGPGFGGPAPVEVARAITRKVQDELGAVGSVRANESVTLRPEISGRISSIGFREGQMVKRGAVLVELDAQVARAEVAQARAQLELARSNLTRTDDLAARSFVSSSARDQAVANVQVLEATLALAQARLDRYTIRAPFDGRVGLRRVSAGDYVKDGADLVSVEDTSTVKVDFTLPERFFGFLKNGQTLQFAVDALPDQSFTATVYAIDSAVDANGRSLVARARAANTGGQLGSGMFARIRLQLSQRPDAVVVPEEAIVPGATGQVVFRVVEKDGGRVALRTPVALGQRRDGMVEVVQGVTAGDLVVVAGQIRLQRDGLPVRVVEPGAAPGGPPGGAGAGAAKGGGAAAAPAVAPGTAPAAAPSAPPADAAKKA
jgi:membrane fusion protein (multidrug efflux system)